MFPSHELSSSSEARLDLISDQKAVVLYAEFFYLGKVSLLWYSYTTFSLDGFKINSDQVMPLFNHLVFESLEIVELNKWESVSVRTKVFVSEGIVTRS